MLESIVRETVMAGHACCQGTSERSSDARPSKLRRALSTTKWIVPTAVLALLPKCPLCIAAYIAVATGCGVSIASATLLRSSLLAVSTLMLTALIAQTLIRCVRTRR